MAPTQNRTRKNDEPASRYREAAELAIEQLDWCINYLRQIHKAKIAGALEHNRNAIVWRARHGGISR
jgi:hypothetical protein